MEREIGQSTIEAQGTLPNILAAISERMTAGYNQREVKQTPTYTLFLFFFLFHGMVIVILGTSLQIPCVGNSLFISFDLYFVLLF